MEGDTITMTDIFKFQQTGVQQDGKIIGELRPTGIRPAFSPTSGSSRLPVGRRNIRGQPERNVGKPEEITIGH